MSYKCSHCHGRHARIESVRQCAKEYYATRERVKPVLEAPTAVTVPGARVPAGFYWSGGDRGYMVIQIRIPAEGRWKGRYFVNVGYDGQPWQAMFEREQRENLLDTLRAGDWGALMLEYGQRTGGCPVCDKKLDPVEKQVGVHGLSGPHGDACAKTVVGQ